MLQIAITGMGCRFPGGVRGARDYWTFLTGKGDGIVEVPADRWNLDLFYDPDPDAPGRMYTRRGGFLIDPLWDFDPEFFGIAPREASIMDPQQRLILEVAYEALDDAGMAGRVAGRGVGVYVGGFMNDNQVRRHLPGARAAINSHTPTSGTFTMLSNRLSYVLDLRGPSMTIDTACSSSLIAIHEAGQAVARGECELAIAGGVNVMLHPETFVSMCKGRFLSPDGRCKSFDAAADGYGRGEGAGMIVLKPVDAALRDRDRIYAVIKATGANQDGRTSGITVPNLEAQAALARKVCADSGLAPSQIGYVEAHGTGTAVGDPIEIGALGQALGSVSDRGEPLVVGSAKAGIGHLEAAAGVASVMKAALTVHHRTIAPQAWLEELNPAIPFSELNVRIPIAVEPFPGGHRDAFAAVNGFGYGGSNAHVILGEAPIGGATPRESRGLPIFPISAATDQATTEIAADLSDGAAAGTDLDSLRGAAWTRRAHYQFRSAVVYDDTKDLAGQLSALAAGEGKRPARAVVGAGTDPVFVFTGMGPQWWGMARGLLLADGAFAEVARKIDSEFKDVAGWSIIEELLHEQEHSRVTRTEVAQPANFLVQASLVAELDRLGVRPAAVVGHSVGEVSAAYVTGVLNLHDALLVSYHRARLQATTAGTGSMLAAGLSEAHALQLQEADARICVAAINAPSSVTLAGDTRALEELQARLSEDGIFARMLKVEVPYHSAFMDPILGELESELCHVHSAEPSLPLYSTVSGSRVTDRRWGAEYWCDNVREPVRFAAAIDALIGDEHRVFLEVGPHPVLSGNVRELLIHAGETGTSISTLARHEDDRRNLLRAVGDLYVAGCFDVPSTAVAGHVPAGHVDLPRYPWQRRTLWSEEPALIRQRRGDSSVRPMLGERTEATAPEWQTELSVARLPWLRDHVVDGLVLLPGAAYLDAALSAAAERTGRERLALESVRFIAPLVIEEHDVPVLRLDVDEASNRFTLRSHISTAAEWTINATGRIVDGDVEVSARASGPEPEATHVAADDLYKQLSQSGLQYGPAFRRIVDARVGEQSVHATIDAASAQEGGHIAAPTVVDAALQSVAALVAREQAGAFVPVGIGSVRRFGPLSPTVTAYVERRDDAGLATDVILSDEEGAILLELVNVEFAAVRPSAPVGAELERLFYETVWESRAAIDELTPAEHGDVNDLAIVVEIGAQPSTRANEIAAMFPGARRVAVTPARELAAETLVAELAFDALGDDSVERVLVVVVAGGSRAKPDAPTGLEAVVGLVATARGLKTALDRLVGEQPERATEDVPGVDRTYSMQGVVVTEGACQCPGDLHQPNLEHAALIGARRSLLNEQPNARWRLVDVEPGSTSGDLGVELRRDVAPHDDADEVCLRDGSRLVPHWCRGNASHLERLAQTVPLSDPEESFELEGLDYEDPADLAARSCERVAPRQGEVEVRLDAAAVTAVVGHEALGFVTRAGAGVEHIVEGDRVWVLAPTPLRRYVTLPAEDCVLGTATAATEPAHCGSIIPLVTAHYALHHAGRLAQDDTVFVQGADSDLGLAAIQVAHSVGARVIGTAGDEEGRKRVVEAGADAVVRPGPLNFVDDVHRVTDGSGADLVLCLEPGEAARQVVRVASEFGQVIHVHAADDPGERESVLERHTLERNLSVRTMDIRALAEARPERFRSVAHDVLDRLGHGGYQPTRAIVHPLARLADATREERSRAVVSLGGTVEARPRRAGFTIRPDATYMITGGFGAFGLATARWLVSGGARGLVLVGRRGASTPAARSQLAAFVAAGVEVAQEMVDIANQAEVRALMRRTADTMPPLRGVFHAAGVVEDVPLADIGTASLRRVLDPKTGGALNLHAALDEVEAELDAFVLYSSVSALVGLVPQIAYAAGNAVLDALAVARRAQGKPALAVNWGALAGGGMAEASEEIKRYLTLLGVTPIDMDRATAMLHECLSLGDEVVGAGLADVDWAKWGAAYPASAASSRFAAHVAAASSDMSGAAALRHELAGLPEEQRAEVLAYVLAEQLAEVLGLSADAIDLATPLPDLGVDSLMTVEFSARVLVVVGIEISALGFGRGTGLRGVAARLAGQIEADTGAESALSTASGSAALPVPRVEPPPADNSSNLDSDLQLRKVA
jgi:acyl transferase domain-containing protein/NADPH:quinone reductase-like Zn-dependent oxidoreductase/NADP-dependent 3-hydroxy acid dehydrogenase YdfG